MVVVQNLALDQISLINLRGKPTSFFLGIPVVDLWRSDAAADMVRACEELGFFKVVNHGIPPETIARLEGEAVTFFSGSLPEKEHAAGTADPFGYGSKGIGANGDVGWVEYLLTQVKNGAAGGVTASLEEHGAGALGSAISEYTAAVRNLACRLLELMAEGLAVLPRDALSRMVADAESDSMFRLNHYPPCPAMQGMKPGCGVTGFGEHTDPQIVSVLRSNSTSGLQISLGDGSWVSVPPDQSAFFVNVGDSLQALTNGRFRSARHRVLANSQRSRMSMIYFGGPPPGESLAPLPMLMGEGEESLYREFTWSEYKKSACRTRLADNRLRLFER